MCLHGIYCMTREEAQAAVSQQPFCLPPKNEPLQDNEHFKTAIPTTPTTRLSQHSDIGRDREKERERERERERVSWICQSHTFCLEQGDRIHPICSDASETTQITQHTWHYFPYYLPILTECAPNRSLSAYLWSTLSISLCEPSYRVSRLFPLFLSQSLSRVADRVKY